MATPSDLNVTSVTNWLVKIMLFAKETPGTLPRRLVIVSNN